MRTYLDMQALLALSHTVTHSHTHTHSHSQLHRHTHTHTHTPRQSISLHTAEDQRLRRRDGGAENKYKARERLMKILNEEIPVKI